MQISATGLKYNSVPRWLNVTFQSPLVWQQDIDVYGFNVSMLRGGRLRSLSLTDLLLSSRKEL